MSDPLPVASLQRLSLRKGNTGFRLTFGYIADVCSVPLTKGDSLERSDGSGSLTRQAYSHTSN